MSAFASTKDGDESILFRCVAFSVYCTFYCNFFNFSVALCPVLYGPDRLNQTNDDDDDDTSKK